MKSPFLHYFISILPSIEQTLFINCSTLPPESSWCTYRTTRRY